MNAESNDVVITGVGPVTSIGVGKEEFWTSLLAGRNNVQRRGLQVDAGRLADLPLASMPVPLEITGSAGGMEFLESQDCAEHRDIAYTLLAIEQALEDAGLAHDRDTNRIGVVQAFEAPGSERTVSKLFELLSAPMPAGPPQGPLPVYELLAPYFYNMQPFFHVHVIGKALGFHGFSTSIHNACASGAYALEVAAQRIRSGQADVMVVAGGEAFDTGVRLEWFRRLELYAQDGRMAPFDARPSGFYVGEGAAALVLESARHAAERNAQGYATYLGGAFAHQGWKHTIPDVRARRLRDVITQALGDRGVSTAELDLIVPHGASTQLSDGYEAVCLADALKGGAGDAVATVFKPNVGHMLAASGIIETLCLVLAIHHQQIPPTLHTRPEGTRLPVPLVTEPTDRPLRIVLKLSTGFTGHDAASLFAKP